jgi:hypothetical protein
MDHASFDRAARVLGTAISRRAGLASAVATILGVSTLPVAVAAAAAAAPSRKPRPQGPCGSGKRKDNICTKDSDCCTGICNTRAGKANKDKKGRCRCVRQGGACKVDKNCCQKSCVDGICGSAADTCDICPTGCPYTTVAAAIAAAAPGATLRIGAGTYDEDLTVGKDLTLTNCNGESVTLRNATPATRTITFDPTAPITTLLTISNLQITTSTPNDGGGGIEGFGNLTLNGTTRIFGCSNGEGGAVRIGDGSTNFTLTMTDDAEISENLCDSYGGGVFIDSYGSMIMNGHAAVKNNGDGGSNGGGIYLYYGATLEMSENAVVSGNDGDMGGGVFLYGGSTMIMTMNDNATVTGNTAYQAGGVFVDTAASLIMLDSSTISSNKATSGSGAGGVHVSPTAIMTMSGSAAVRENLSEGGNGGGMVLSGSLTMSESATITQNTAATSYTGGGIYGIDEITVPPAALTVNAPATITNNTPDNCAGSVSC